MKTAILVLCCSVSAAIFAPAHAISTDEQLQANGLDFSCTVLKHTSEDGNAPTKQIMLLHGFPMFRVWWSPLLEHWDDMLEDMMEDMMEDYDEEVAISRSSNSTTPPTPTLSVSVHAVACDLRGYSPGASPDNIEDYDYSIFANDTFALAEAAGFDGNGFHLIGHDHGAALAWYIASNDPNNQVLSLTTMSVPHIGLLSDAVCGNNTDEEQVIASNYFNQFALPDSAFQNNGSLTEFFQNYSSDLASLETTQFQKMLWWYNGSLAKYFSLPRVVSDMEVEAYGDNFGAEATALVEATRAAIPMEERPCVPAEEENNVGVIEIPTLFICGVDDTALLCNNTYATDFPPDLLPDYEHANYRCGHDFFLEGQCKSMEESKAVMDKITAFVLGTIGESESQDSSSQDEDMDIEVEEEEDPTSESKDEDMDIDAEEEEEPTSGSRDEDTVVEAEEEPTSESKDEDVVIETEEASTSGMRGLAMLATKLPVLGASLGAIAASSSLFW